MRSIRLWRVAVLLASRCPTLPRAQRDIHVVSNLQRRNERNSIRRVLRSAASGFESRRVRRGSNPEGVPSMFPTLEVRVL